MGIYIKGMEMPGSCGECRFLNPGNYKGKEYPCVCDVGDFLVKPSETDLRDGLCPLVEVPDHGDLIDRDAAPQLVAVLYTDVTGTAVNPTYKIDLSSLPVVIPADKGE